MALISTLWNAVSAVSTSWGRALTANLGVLGNDTSYHGNDTVATGDDAKADSTNPNPTSWTQNY